jgi:hypothetical protein
MGNVRVIRGKEVVASMVNMQKGVHHIGWSSGLSFKCRELLADHGDQPQQGEL